MNVVFVMFCFVIYLCFIYTVFSLMDCFMWRVLLYCRDVESCSTIQKEISECFEFMKTFINDENFVIHVKNDLPDMGDIEDRIDQNLLDLKRTDCSIVFAGKFVIYLWFQNDPSQMLYYKKQKNWHIVLVLVSVILLKANRCPFHFLI